MWWVDWFDGTALYREFFELSNIVFCIICIKLPPRNRQKRVEPQCLCMLGGSRLKSIKVKCRDCQKYKKKSIILKCINV